MRSKQLVIDHLPFAVNIAGSISKRLPRHVDGHDVRQEACVGLIDAAAKYDARKGVPFKAYARRRIGGAVLDALRKQDHLSRRTRARIKAEAAEAIVQPVQLADPGQVPGVLVLPYEYAAAGERRRVLAAAIQTLPARLRFVLRAYYFEEKFMHEIGVELGLKTGRVSQLHARALRLLREYLDRCGLTSTNPFTSGAQS